MATLQRNLSGEVVSVPVTRLIEQYVCFPRLSFLLHSPLKKVTVGEKPISRQIPDWHVCLCQSGIWRLPGPEDGVYAYLGAFKGVYSGNNSTGKPFKLYVWGGNPPPRKINFGNSDNCANTFSLTASVGGQTVANSVDGNSEWGKSGSFSFDVPKGASFSITSNGMLAYGCDYGTFSIFRYQ
ncbi:hypothetical protein I3G02_005067 [Salmonella enterica]|nr:hypothetical protein [Salmonella enterica]